MTTLNPVADRAREGDVAVLTIDSSPVNALSAAVREANRGGVQRAGADPSVKAIVPICAGRTFFAGADIAEFGQPVRGPSPPGVQSALQDCPKPVIAAIHGAALGGGLETALVCHYRVALPSAKLGLPEIKLGPIPGAGGTQRLPCLIGPEKALEVILSGAPFSAREAKESGVVDSGEPRAGAIAFACQAIARGLPLRKARDLKAKVVDARAKPEMFAAIRAGNARKFRRVEAWEKAIAAVRDAVELPFDEGVRRERARFVELLNSPQSRAQRYVSFAERKVWKVADIPEDTPAAPVNKVGVIGVGTMGGGIAMNFLNAGAPVVIVEVGQEALDRGLSVIRRSYESTAKKGRLTLAEVEAGMRLLSPELDFAALADCGLVIEAASEDMALKQDIFRRLDEVAKPGALLASNTSYPDVNVIAAVTRRPESVLGMHFFSPANVMRLLEIVRGERTSKAAIATAMRTAKAIGKIAAVVGVCHGFLGNRMLAQRQREAQKLTLEGAMPWDVDRVLYHFGLPVGPFAMSDLAGLDIGWSKDKSSSSTVREILCEMGRREQKTGGGFYDYDEKRTPAPSPVVEEIVLAFAAKKGFIRRRISDAEILDRCLIPMINEGATILEEGKAQRASDIEVIWVNGYGWPSYRGGPMHYGDEVGADRVLAILKTFEASMGADYAPSALLERVAAKGGRLHDLRAGVGKRSAAVSLAEGSRAAAMAPVIDQCIAGCRAAVGGNIGETASRLAVRRAVRRPPPLYAARPRPWVGSRRMTSHSTNFGALSCSAFPISSPCPAGRRSSPAGRRVWGAFAPRRC